MKVLVTGGAGYVGSELIKRLMVDPEVSQIIIYDNMSRGNYNFFMGHVFAEQEKMKFVEGDLLDSRKLKNALKDIDVVYHLAALVTTPFANSDSHSFEQINHWGTAELVYAVEEAKVSKFIYVSSTSVYGASDDINTEATIPNPKTFYGAAKLRGEEHVDRLKSKMDTYILRCGNVYGYSKCMRNDAVINRFVFEANFKNKISIHGNGKQSRAFVHINLISKVLSEIIHKPVPSGTYNVVDKNLRVLDIVDVVKEIFPQLEFIFVNQHLHLRQLSVSTESKLRDYIDYADKRELKEELVEFKEKFAF